MRRLLWAAQAAASTLGALFATLRRQRLAPLAVVALVVFLLALVFAFLAAVPFLSPFVYPLF
ncbi:MAG: hypothetical protein HY077_07835 [Elusimicrobia bacterium]|nr:hypothetical protein [Elusimicrobiota bacterium]